MVKAKMTIEETSIPVVMRDGRVDFGTIGHTFTMRARVKVSKRKLGPLSGDGIDYPELEWKETIDWFELSDSNTWEYAADRPSAADPKVILRNGVTTDMYAKNPNGNTFVNWARAKFFNATGSMNNPPALLTAAVDSKGVNASTEEKDKLAKHWIAEHGFEWIVGVTDVPALGLNPSARSRGGGGESLVKSKTRRRVVHFDLGFEHGPRATATQVLEMVDGVPTIHKFFVPGISKVVTNDEGKLALWRAQIDQIEENFSP